MNLTQKSPRRRPLPTALIAAAVAALLGIGCVTAAPAALRMAADALHYFEVPDEFRRLSEGIEPQPFSSAVGASVTDQGYTLTVEGIAVDDAFITLYYTITGEDPIPVTGDGSPKQWSIRYQAEGTYLQPWGSHMEVELVDEHTMRGIQRNAVLEVLPDEVGLKLYSDELFPGIYGTWYLSLLVDKSEPAAKSLVAEPGQTFTMSGHRVTVDKVVVAPSGSGIVLTEAGESPLRQFVLRDDQGNILPTERHTGVSRPILPVSNFIEFYNGRTDMTSITIIPWEADGDSHAVEGALDELPLTDSSAENGYTLLSLTVGDHTAVGVFEAKGILGESDVYTPGFLLLDDSGAAADLGKTSEEAERDAATGLWTITVNYPDATQEQTAQITKVMFRQPNCTLLEDQAVTIELTS